MLKAKELRRRAEELEGKLESLKKQRFSDRLHCLLFRTNERIRGLLFRNTVLEFSGRGGSDEENTDR